MAISAQTELEKAIRELDEGVSVPLYIFEQDLLDKFFNAPIIFLIGLVAGCWLPRQFAILGFWFPLGYATWVCVKVTTAATSVEPWQWSGFVLFWFWFFALIPVYVLGAAIGRCITTRRRLSFRIFDLLLTTGGFAVLLFVVLHENNLGKGVTVFMGTAYLACRVWGFTNTQPENSVL